MDKKDYNQMQNPSAFIDQNQPEPQTVAEIQSEPIKSQPTPQKGKKNPLKKYLLIGAIVITFIAFLIIILILVAKKNQNHQIKPTPTPEIIKDDSEPQQSFNQEITDQVNNFEKDLNNLEIQEVELNVPQIDWELNFDK